MLKKNHFFIFNYVLKNLKKSNINKITYRIAYIIHIN